MRPEHWLYTIPLRLRSLFRRPQADQELDDELCDHLERKTEEYLAHGMTQEDAHRRARLDLDGFEQTKEKCRDVRRVNWIQDFAQDLRYGLRMLRKSSGFATVAILTLAIGIGLNTTLFSVFNAVALKPVPVRDSERVVRLERWFAGNMHGESQYAFSYAEFRRFAPQNHILSSLVAVSFPFRVAAAPLNTSAPSTADTALGSPESATAELASANYFAELGVSPALGRLFREEEDRTPGADPVAVLSYPYWQAHFAGDAAVVGNSSSSTTRCSRSSASRLPNSSAREIHR